MFQLEFNLSRVNMCILSFPVTLKAKKEKKMSSSKYNRVSKKRKPPAKISVVKSSRPLKFLDSVLCHLPQLGQIIRAKPCAVSQHPASEDKTTPMSPDVPYVFPDYHTTACSIQCLAQTLKNIEAAKEHVNHLGRIFLLPKPAQIIELISNTRLKLDQTYHKLDEAFHPIFVLLKEEFDLDQLIENDSNPKLIKKKGKIEISPVGSLKKESHQQEDPLLTTVIIENQPDCSFKLEDVFPSIESQSFI